MARPTYAVILAFLSFLLPLCLVEAALLPLPMNDSWFTAPEGWIDKAPGTVLRVRASAYDWPLKVQNASDVFQVLFRSTDSVGNDSWAVTTVFVPECASKVINRNRSLPTWPGRTCGEGMIVYGVPYDTVNPNAVPSYLLQFNEPYGDVSLLLRRGWFVSVPDYEGPKAAFTAGMQAGYATLDSVRAVLSAGPAFGLSKNASVGMWGYSGGGGATGFAAEIMSEYAPELIPRTKGIIIGGPPANCARSVDMINKREVAGLIVASMLGITTPRPAAFRAILDQVKTEGPFNITGFVKGYGMTGLEALFWFYNQDIWEYFKNGRASVWTDELVQIYEEDGIMGRHGTPPVPIYVYSAINDGFGYIEDLDEAVDNYCKGGVPQLLYHRNTVGAHNDELFTGRQRALDFLGKVLDGDKHLMGPMVLPEKGCQVLNITETLGDLTKVR